MLFSALSLLAAGAVARPHLAARQAGAQSWTTSSDGSSQLASQDAPVSGAGNANGARGWTLTVDDSSAGVKQTINGFGAAVTDSTVSNFNALSSDDQAALIKDLVTPDGANFQLLRHSIASSDMSPNSYSYDDNNGQADPNLGSFNLGDSGNAMAAMLSQFRQAQGNLTILGSSWSAPAWMKSDDNTINTDNADAFAQYFVKYLQAYQSAGAPIDYITIQNEPLHNGPTDFTMGVDAQTSGNLIQNNIGPALSAASLNTKIWAYDHNTDVPDYPSTVISTAGQYIDAVAWHCYQQGGADWSVLSDFQSSHSGINQYMTECWTHQNDGWGEIVGFTLGPLQNWASGAISWPMGTDTNFGPHLGDGCSTCAGLFQVENGQYSLQRDYYMLAQFSKFIPKGATVQNSTGSYTFDDGTGVQAVATNNPDGTKTVVMQNLYDDNVYINVNFQNNVEWSGSLPGQAVTTWVLPAN